MNKRIRLLYIFLAGLCAGLFFSCALFQTDGDKAVLSPKIRKLVDSAVFEVVIEKKQEDAAVYERPLDWEMVPYAIRSDKYYSIGTAFAVSPSELVTAFHVINLGSKSLIYPKYFIRDSKGKVYEVDKATRGDSERDFLMFTIKDHAAFEEYFNFKKDFDINAPVLSIGNALGEGIIVRSGLVLGTVAESESGRWNLLKSSADGNPGNSGGPLVNSKGEVIAIVTSLRDNILYSTPATELINCRRDALVYRSKGAYQHIIIPNRLNDTFEIDVPLPEDYRAVQDKIVDAYKKYYGEAMTKLFASAPEYLTGPNNAYLLNSSVSLIFPQVDFVDPNDNNWKTSHFDVKSVDFADDGVLYYSRVSDINFFKISKPKSVELEKIDTGAREIMDTVLENWRTERTLWRGDRYRILSFGEPAETGVYKDSAGRTWMTAYWEISFEDKVMIMYVLPLPNGPAVIATLQSSKDIFIYKWDIEKVCDHIHSAYSGTIEEWSAFLDIKKYRPDSLSDIKLFFETNSGDLALSLPDIMITTGNDVFEWTELSQIFLLPSYYKIRDNVELGITKVILDKNNRREDYVILTKNLKPDSRLGTSYRESWDDLVRQRFPYNGRPVISQKDNSGSVGAVIQAVFPDDDVRWTLYAAMEDPNEELLLEKFDNIKSELIILR